ncbi:MAG: amidophosphoribosyltransferase [Clostridium sp.]|nr:amidophosphoribosyltransferase [Clostridium sp.]
MSRIDKVMTGLGEECGVFGAYDMDGGNVAPSVYYGLFALQHRGQESCGIAVTDTYGQRKVLSKKGLGLVNDVFDEESLHDLKGNLGVGHVRYSTAGGTRVENAQPLVINYVKGTLAIAHNGNLVNAIDLRKELEYTGAIFQTTIDSEVIAYHIARERLNVSRAEDAVKNAMKKIKGAYALVVSSPRKMIGARDPLGLKPLCIGKRDNTYFLASESCAIAAVDAAFVRDVLPGEIVTITKEGMASDTSMAVPSAGQARCIFEYIYFARTDSTLDGINVYHSRITAGRALAESYPVEADLVVGVPDSGLVAAKGYSEQSGIPYGMAFHKNSYVGRTFIKPSQSERESSVKIKLNVIPEVVKGKRIIMVDDSIVRGTTCANIIRMLKAAGATEVHVRISSPPFLYPCYFGTDVPSNEQLIAHSHTPEQIRKMIGADSLGYMEVSKLKNMVGDLGYCDACFTGKYPMEVPDGDISQAFEQGTR